MNMTKLAWRRSCGGLERQAKRFLLACAAVAALAMLLAASSAYEATAGQSVSPDGARNAAALVSIDAVLDDVVENPFAPSDELLRPFEAELFSLPSMSGVQCSSDLRLLGYSQSGGAEDALNALTEKLKGKGWEVVSSDQALCRSFSKGSGTYRWVFASAAQVGDSASVVVQWSTAQGGGQ